MTNEEKCRHILRKYPSTKFDRASFFWVYMGEYHNVKFYILPDQWKEFWKDFSGVERSLREVLKEEEFKLPPELDQKRYEKKAQFQKQYQKK